MLFFGEAHKFFKVNLGGQELMMNVMASHFIISIFTIDEARLNRLMKAPTFNNVVLGDKCAIIHVHKKRPITTIFHDYSFEDRVL